jgi:hypothetical protein
MIMVVPDTLELERCWLEQNGNHRREAFAGHHAVGSALETIELFDLGSLLPVKGIAR